MENSVKQVFETTIIMETRINMLNRIFSEFQQITQSLPCNISSAGNHEQKCTSLIEFLEVQDCGSIGGFDRENPVIFECGGYRLYERFLALVRKYDNVNDIKKVCGFDLEKLGRYFRILGDLRGECINAY